MKHWHFRVSWLLLVIGGSLVVAGELKDDKFGFRLTIPDGFKPEPSLVHGDTIYSYVRPDGSAGLRQVIQIARMRGTIGSERLEAKDVSKFPQVTVTQEKWKTTDVDVMRVPQQAQGIDMIILTAQIPLKHEAIQIAVGGEKSTEQSLWQLLRALLASLEEERHELSTSQRVEKLLNGLYGLAGLVVVIVLVVVWFRRGARKRKQRNQELAINYPVD
jgi:hypothetical protein